MHKNASTIDSERSLYEQLLRIRIDSEEKYASIDLVSWKVDLKKNQNHRLHIITHAFEHKHDLHKQKIT